MNAKFKTVTAIACSALCALTLTACSNGKSTNLGKPSKAEYPDYRELIEESFVAFRDKAERFSSEFAEYVCSSAGESANCAVSPFSVFSALSLAAECAGGNTRQEILSALDVTYEQLSEQSSLFYRSVVQDGKTCTVAPTNSVWVNGGTRVNTSCIDALARNYFCHSYSTDFVNDNVQANKAVRYFVKKQTKGLIDRDFNLDTQTLFALVNTLYLKALWNSYGDEIPFAREKYKFASSDGTENPVRLLQGSYALGRAYDGVEYTSFYTTACGGIKIKFIVPKDGFTLAQAFTAENIYEANAVDDYNATDEVNKVRYYTRCLFPEYKCAYNNTIDGVLREKFGINLLFEDPAKYGEGCDFSPLTDSGAYCGSVRHVTELTVNKRGIEGAAVTIIPGAGAAGPDEYETVYEDFIVDKAFGFVITDNYGTTLFSGVVNKI